VKPAIPPINNENAGNNSKKKMIPITIGEVGCIGLLLPSVLIVKISTRTQIQTAIKGITIHQSNNVINNCATARPVLSA
jgi:hypothetical protein